MEPTPGADLINISNLLIRKDPKIPDELYPDTAYTVSRMLLQAFRATYDFQQLEAGIIILSESVTRLRAANDTRSIYQARLISRLFLMKFETLGRRKDLEQAITWLHSELNDDDRNRESSHHNDETTEDVAEAWDLLSICFLQKYERYHEIPDLKAGIDALGNILIYTSDDNPNKISVRFNLARALSDEFGITGNYATLDKAIAAAEIAARTVPRHHPGRAKSFDLLSILLSCKPSSTESFDDVMTACKWAEAAVRDARDDSPEKALFLGNLCNRYHALFAMTSDFSDLYRAIGIQAANIFKAPRNPLTGSWLTNLGQYCKSFYEMTLDSAFLDAAISAHRVAVTLYHPLDQRTGLAFFSLSCCLHKQYEDTESLEALNESISIAREAIQKTQQLFTARIKEYQEHLAKLLLSRYDVDRSDDEALDEAFELAQEAVRRKGSQLGQEGTHRFGVFGIIAIRIGDRALPKGKQGETEIDQALALTDDALRLVPKEHSAYPILLNSSACVILKKLCLHGTLRDIKDGSDRLQQALDSESMPESYKPTLISNQALFAAERYARSKKMNDLQESIELAEKALTLMPVDYHDRRRHVYETADLLSVRFVRTGEPKDLHRAIELASLCLDGLDPGKPLFAERSYSLSLLLCKRYGLVGLRQDLENAIFHSRRACEVTKPTHDLYGQYVAGHASYLITRFDRERVPSDFNSAKKILEHTLEVTDERYSNKRPVYSTLANLLYIKYQITGEMEYLRGAIDFMEKALAGKPGGQDTPSLRTQLGNFYEQRYQHTHDRKDLETAIAYAAEGVEALPEDHWDRARLLDHLAYQHKQKWLANGEVSDRQAAAQAYKKGFLAETSPPINRIECGKDGARLLYETSQARPALDLLQGCLELFPKVHSWRLGWEDQQFWMMRLCSGMASDAAAIALQIGGCGAQAPSLALSCLETGAALIIGAFISCRNDVSELAAVNPELAARFERLRLEVDVPLLLDVNNRAGVRGVEYEAGQQRRREATDALDDTLKQIRAIPGFADFLLSPSESKLVALAKSGGGPIVILNSSQLVGRADAIIITETGISTLHLSGLQYAASSPPVTETKEMFSDAEIYSGSLRTVATRNKRLSHILKLLWEGAVQPVVKHLGYSPCSDPHKLPHIFWIRRGWPFNAAPIHAAGIYNSQDTTTNTMAYVVSSYAPSLKALMYARERDVDLLKMTPERSSRLLVITMPKTPGSTDLPGVETEAEHIIAACNGVLETEVLEVPTVDSVLRRLKDAQAVHFACHGCTDTKDLSNSYLALCKPAHTNPNLEPDDNHTTANIIVDPLRVRHIASSLVTQTFSSSPQHPRRKISGPQVAYLSACSTAATANNQRMADEAVHLAAGFLLAGFSHVIATLWDTHSDICVKIAELFYAELVRAKGDMLLGEEEGDTGKAARNRKLRIALHVAVLKVRERRLRQPLAWAGFVHLGA